MADLYAWDHSVDARIQTIAEKLGLADNESFRKDQVPGLKNLLDDYIADTDKPDDSKQVSYIDFHRRLLKVFKDSHQDNTYQDLLQKYTEDERKRLDDFVEGADPKDVSAGFEMGPSLGCREELEKMHNTDSIVQVSAAGVVHMKGLSNDGTNGTNGTDAHGSWWHHQVEKLKEFFHQDDDHTVLVYKDATFQNWGLNINNTPRFTCVPTTVKGVQRIVGYAAENNMSVRCSGYRHSWAPIFGQDGQIVISFLQLRTATKLPNIASLPLPESRPSELESIDIVPGSPIHHGNYLVRVGCATTNERLRRWCVKNNRVTLPLNVIMVEITLGGSNAPICHGAGRTNQTLSDLVRKIEYVDAHGKLQVVEDLEHLRAASGCFGLMGVVTHITMELPPMSYAEMIPLKMPVIRAIPPPPDMTEEDIKLKVPPALRSYWDVLTPAQRKQDQQDFERRATDDYYCEWFWFPFSDFAWVNTWNTVQDPKGAEDWPNSYHIFLSFAQTSLMNILQNATILNDLVKVTGLSEAAVTLISRAAMFALPSAEPNKPIKTFLPDALHFQRAIQNVRVRDTEIEMPLVAKANAPDTPDYTISQRAWWDAIFTVYEPENRKICPMRMPLEMRFMGDSNVIMAPQRGNHLGTCSIEVLTLHGSADIWEPFAQQVLDKWMSYKDPMTGKKLNTRPHWAKEWKGFNVDGKPWVQKLKNESYKQEIVQFKAVLERIGKGHGWTLSDLKRRFSNDLFNEFYFDDVHY